MTISFSGLASGLDTSSWVESLTALKRAKVTTLEQKKEAVVVQKDALSNIRSFFTSFRSMIEKVTDARFNIPTMNVFAQNLATSSNLAKLTATADTTAEEKTYNIKVDKLATQTTARSTYKTIETVQTQATDVARLSSLGYHKLDEVGTDEPVQSGKIYVTVNGVKKGVSVNANETITSFINKLANVGVEASYNNETGKFNVNVGINDIQDGEDDGSRKTGLISALNLVGVNEAYTSNKLQFQTTVTNTVTATETTQLKDLADGYNFVDRALTADEINSGKYIRVKHATGKAEFEVINSSGETKTIAVNGTTKISEVVSALKGAGLYASFEDGVLEIAGGDIKAASGLYAYDISKIFGLDEEPESAMSTGNPLTHTVIIPNKVELTTRLHEDLGVSKGYFEVTKDDGTKLYEKIYGGMTMTDLITDFGNMGITATLDREAGVLTITGGEFASLTDAEVQALCANDTIQEPEAALKKGTNLLSLLGLDVEANMSIAHTRAKSMALTYQKTANATEDDLVGDFITLPNDKNITIHAKDGTVLGAVTVDENTTFGELFANLAEYGVDADINNGVVSFDSSDDKYLTGAIISAMGISVSYETIFQTTTVGTTSSSSHLTYNETDVADDDSIINDFLTITNANNELVVKDIDGNATGTVTVTDTMSFRELFEALVPLGVDGDIHDGVLTLIDNNGGYVDGTFAAAMGIGTDYTTVVTTTTVGSTQTLGQKTYSLTHTANESTTFAELGINSNQTYYIVLNEGNITATVTSSMTIGEWFRQMGEYGIDGDIHDGTILLQSDSGHYITGTLANTLGIGTYNYTTQAQGTATTIVTGTDTLTVSVSQTITVDSAGTITVGVTNTITIDSLQTITMSVTMTEIVQQTDVPEQKGFLQNITLQDTSTLTALSQVEETGTLTGTYKISTTADLQRLAELTNSNRVGSSAVFIQANDIDMSGVSDFVPIGTDSGFVATYNGNGYEVSNLSLTADDNYMSGVVGFFGGVYGGSIENLKLTNMSLTVTSGSNACDIGLLAGQVENSSISNCVVSGNILSAKNCESIGGAVGEVNNSLIDSVNANVDIEVTGSCGGAGGLAGNFFASSVTNSFASGTQITGNIHYVGGFIGSAIDAEDLSISNCGSKYTTVKSTNTSAQRGGFVGYVATDDGTITDCICYVGNSNASSSGVNKGSFIGLRGGEGSFSGCVTNQSGPVGSGSSDGITVQSGTDALFDSKLSELQNNAWVAPDWQVVTTTVVTTQVDEIRENAYINNVYRTDTSNLTSLSAVSESTTLTGTYKISTTEELQQLATMTNNGKVNSSAVFVMANDIDLSSVSDWTSIGRQTQTFRGTFDGNGYEIQNLTQITANRNSQAGLFGYTIGATIKNLGMRNVNIDTNAQYVGAIAGRTQNSAIENCYVVNSDIETSSGSANAGGIVGFFISSGSSCVDSCYVKETTVKAGDSGSNVGGIVGSVGGSSYAGYTSIKNSIFESGDSDSPLQGNYCGLIAGEAYARIEGCYANARTAPNAQYSGGIVGRLYYAATMQFGFVENCYAELSYSGDNNRGGIAGTADSGTTISNSYWSGSGFECVAPGQSNGTITNSSQVASGSHPDGINQSVNGFAAYCQVVTVPVAHTEVVGIEESDFLNNVYRIDTTDLVDVMDVDNFNSATTFKVTTTAGLNKVLAYNGSDKVFVLDNDIDFDGTSWTQGAYLNSTLDGNGYSIKNVSFNYSDTDPEYENSMFANISQAGTIKNIAIDGYTIAYDGDEYLGSIEFGGALAMYNQGHVENCFVKNLSLNVDDRYTSELGNTAVFSGLVWYNSGEIKSCYVSGDIISNSGMNNIAGLCNSNIGTIEDSHYTGRMSIETTNYEHSAGLVVSNTGTITNSSVNITNESNDIEGYDFGGISYENSGTIDGCVARITGSHTNLSAQPGLIAAINTSDGNITNCQGFITNNNWELVATQNGNINSSNIILSDAEAASLINSMQSTDGLIASNWTVTEVPVVETVTVQENTFLNDIYRIDTTNLTDITSISSSTNLTSGTYKISTTAGLQQLSTMTNAGKIGNGCYFVLANDIDLASVNNFVAIGTSSNNFTATFDGNGYKISNFNQAYSGTGLFYDVSIGGTIKNVAICGAYVRSDINYAGILVRSLTYGAEVENCYIESGTISVNNTTDGSLHVGGLVGFNGLGHITSCYTSGINIVASRANSSGNGTLYAGGIVGQNDGSISYCFAKDGTVTATSTVSDDVYVGGITGHNGMGGNISNCSTNIAVNYSASSGTVNQGGIAGYNEGDISECYYDNDIPITTQSGATINAGQLVGLNAATGGSTPRSVTDCKYSRVNGSSSADAFGSNIGNASNNTLMDLSDLDSMFALVSNSLPTVETVTVMVQTTIPLEQTIVTTVMQEATIPVQQTTSHTVVQVTTQGVASTSWHTITLDSTTTSTVGIQQTITVGSTQTLTVGSAGTLTVDVAQTLTVDVSQTITVDITATNTITANDTSDRKTYNKTYTMTQDTTFRELGLTSNSDAAVSSTLTVNYQGVDQTITMTSDNTVGDLMVALAGYGIESEIHGGTITVSGTSDGYIKSISGFLGATYNNGESIKSGFGLVQAYSTDSTTTVVNGTNDAADRKTRTLTFDMDSDTTFTELGKTDGTAVVTYNGQDYTITMNGDNTIGDLMTALAGFGIESEIRDGVLITTGTTNGWIKSATGGILGLGIDLGLGNTYNTAITSTTYGADSTSTTFIRTTNPVSLRSTKVVNLQDSSGSNLGITTGTYEIVQDGVTSTETITEDTTVADLMSQLSYHGIVADIAEDGSISLNGHNNSFLKTSSLGGVQNSNVVSTLFAEWDFTRVYESNHLEIPTPIEEAVTRDTKLADIIEKYNGENFRAGNVTIVKNGVQTILQVNADDTIGTFMDEIGMYGFESVIDDTGRLIVRNTGNSSLQNYAGGSNVLGILGLSDWVVTNSYQSDVQNVVTTSDLFVNATEDTVLKEVVGTKVNDNDVNLSQTFNSSTMDNFNGKLEVLIDGETSYVDVDTNETIGTLLEKFRSMGLEATITGGQICIQSGFSDIKINGTETDGSTFFEINDGESSSTSDNNRAMKYRTDIGGFASSSESVLSTTFEDKNISVSNWASTSTKLSDLNITSGTFTIYRDGQKADIEINENTTFYDLQKAFNNKFGEDEDNGDIQVSFDKGYLCIKSKSGKTISAGASNDTSNFASVTGIESSGTNAVSARELFMVNSSSKVTSSNLFRNGVVTAGTFTVGNLEITIDDNTTFNDIINKINYERDPEDLSKFLSGATAYWDNVAGTMVIKARESGSMFVNIESGTSNFTDILGLTSSDGVNKRMNIEAQELGGNAKFYINGTEYTSSSNTIDSSISRIEGVTINLHDVTDGEEVQLKIEKDKESAANAMEDVVNSYNDLMEAVDTAIAREGSLSNQTMLKSIRNQLKSYMTGSLSGLTSGYSVLDNIGISVASAAASNISTTNAAITQMSFDKDKFMSAFSTNAAALQTLVVGDWEMVGDTLTLVRGGALSRIEQTLENALQGVSGYFDAQTNSFNSQIKNLEEKITKANKEVARYQKMLENKFSSMDMMIAQMQQQYSSFLQS